MNKILKTYKENNKLSDHGIFMLNDLLIKYDKKKLNANAALLTTIKSSFIKNFTDIRKITPPRRKRSSSDILDYSHYPDNTTFSSKST